MTERAYTQLVLLTERPGARIGRVPAEELSEAELTVLTMLDWIDKAWDAYIFDRDFFALLLCNQTPEWLESAFAGMRRIGAHKTLRRIQRALRVLNLPRQSDVVARAIDIENLDEKRKRIANRALWSLWDESLHECLMQFVFAHADTIPGADSLKDLSGQP